MINVPKNVVRFIKMHCNNEDATVDEIDTGFVVKTDNKTFYLNEEGAMHRDGAPAYITDKLEAYYQNGKLHNENGYAKIMKTGTSCHYFNGLLHKSNGAAIVHADGQKEYYLNGTPVTKSFKKWASKKKLEAQEDDFLIFVFENDL